MPASHASSLRGASLVQDPPRRDAELAPPRARSVDRVVLALLDVSDEAAAVVAAVVLADWFGASVQIMTDDPDAVTYCERLTANAGVVSNPVGVLPTVDTIDALVAHLHSVAPALCVVDSARQALAVMERSGQPTFVPIAPEHAHRMSTGPLVVPINDESADLDALAVAAIWASALDLAVLLVQQGAASDQVMNEHMARLHQMGVSVSAEPLSPQRPQLVDIALGCQATALVVGAQWSGCHDLAIVAEAAGQPTLLAPKFDAGATSRRVPVQTTDRVARDQTAPGSAVGMVVMSADECAAALASNSLGRLAYVESGHPVIVPVNYSIHEGTIMFRSLPGGKLDAAERNDAVCLEIDGIDEDRRWGWSVLAQGRLEVIADQSELRKAWEHVRDPWVDATAWQWLRLEPLSLTGRTIARHAD